MFAMRALLVCFAFCLQACSSGTGSSTPVAASLQSQPPEADAMLNGTTVHVTALQTSQLPEAMTRQYGIERAPTTVLLLVNVRGGATDPAPAITATVTDLQERTNVVALREVHVTQPGESTVDYLGTVEVSLPDTLRFTVDAKRGGSTATVQLSRDFYPQ